MTPSNSRSARSRTSQAAAAAPSREASEGLRHGDHENGGQHHLAAGARERRGLLQGDGGAVVVVGGHQDTAPAAHRLSSTGTRGRSAIRSMSTPSRRSRRA